MLLVLNKQTHDIVSNHGKNSRYPKGDIPNLPDLPESHVYVKIDDSSELAEKLMTGKCGVYVNGTERQLDPQDILTINSNMLNENRAEKRAELNRRCKNGIEKSITFTTEAGVTHDFPFRKDPDQGNFSMVKDFIEMTGTAQPYDGVLLTQEDHKNLALLFGQQFYNNYNKCKALKATLDLATTIEEVDVVSWD